MRRVRSDGTGAHALAQEAWSSHTGTAVCNVAGVDERMCSFTFLPTKMCACIHCCCCCSCHSQCTTFRFVLCTICRTPRGPFCDHECMGSGRCSGMMSPLPLVTPADVPRTLSLSLSCMRLCTSPLLSLLHLLASRFPLLLLLDLHMRCASDFPLPRPTPPHTCFPAHRLPAARVRQCVPLFPCCAFYRHAFVNEMPQDEKA